jgi:ribosomal-protein-alanine N-acetyltransferase
LSAEAARQGAERLFLEVATGNAPARALYAAMGFVEIGQRRHYYPDGDDALIMVVPVSAA